MIEPYYKDDWVTIYFGKSETILSDIDIVPNILITDPPYEQRKDGGGMMANRGSYKQIGNELSEFDPAWVTGQAAKIGHGYIFHGKKHLSYWQQFAEGRKWGWDTLIYGKNNPAPFKSFRYMSDMEWIFFFRRPQKCYWNNDAQTSCYRKIKMVNCVPSPHGHPTEKNLGVIKELLTVSTAEQHLILDPYAGACTTGRAAKDLNRRCICIDNKEKYCEIGANRMRQEVMTF